MRRQPTPRLGLLMSAAVFTLAATGAASCVAPGTSSAIPAARAGEASSSPARPVDPSRDASSPAPSADASASDVSDPESTVPERERYRAALLDPTFDVLEKQPGFQAGGLDPIVDEIVVYWKGQFGPGAQAAVEEANRRGVEVKVIPVSHSYDELRIIAVRLLGALNAKGIEVEGFGIGGDPFDQVSMWGRSLDTSTDTRTVARDIAADVLPTDVRFVITPSPGEVVPAVSMDDKQRRGTRSRLAASRS
jgi:hypothetical protein